MAATRCNQSKGSVRVSGGTSEAARARRRWPIGAELQAGGGTHFRVWAPQSKSVIVELSPQPPPGGTATRGRKLRREPGGYFSGFVAEAEAGALYRLRVDTGCFPDPASRYQPDGPHGPSQIVDPVRFKWTDQSWQGIQRGREVVYEMHIGTYTPEGTWRAAMRELPELAQLGITVLEVMPVADFPGRFGWGYDGVNLFAPTRLYGPPDDFRAFVDRAHSLGLGVILDVVYNHVGPDGNYLKEFSADYFTTRYANEWGEPLNFDGKNSGPVREFFRCNAGYWVAEFHVDGLRLDATQQIFDRSPKYIITEITEAVREAAPERQTFVVAENETQNSALITESGCDAIWNDDFHHSIRVRLTGHREVYFADYQGTPQEIISAVKRGFLYQGQWYAWQKKRRGTPAWQLNHHAFVHFLENHDQVANSLRGLRLAHITHPGQLRAMTALLLLGPAIPLLFQGQEFGSSAPFLFFADHHPELARLVAKGRRAFLNQFKNIAQPECDPFVHDPADEQIFLRCRLDLSERKRHSGIYQLHRDLLRLRRTDPVFSSPRREGVDGAVLSADAFVLRFFGEADERLLLVNLGPDLLLRPMSEPLLAPPPGADWKLLWSSENPAYGGEGTSPFNLEQHWRLTGRTALVLQPENRVGTDGQAASHD